jgi:hypothetical protein
MIDLQPPVCPRSMTETGEKCLLAKLLMVEIESLGMRLTAAA